MPLKKTKSSVQNLFNKSVRNNPHKTSGTGLLYNKYLLYISFIVCIINIVLFMFSGDFISVAIFLLVGYLTSFFSKNMIIVLFSRSPHQGLYSYSLSSPSVGNTSYIGVASVNAIAF